MCTRKVQKIPGNNIISLKNKNEKHLPFATGRHKNTFRLICAIAQEGTKCPFSKTY
jgi:hypothetical protein